MPPALRVRATPLAMAVLFVALTAIPLIGCATRPVAHETATPAASPVALRSAAAPPASDPTAPVLRYGRYTWVELVPERSQQDLMLQVVDVTLPTTMNATVGEALRYLLLRTGFRLCDHSGTAPPFDTMPLPAAHMHLGPLTLRDALRIVAGPAWSLTVDDGARRVCFVAAQATANASDPLNAIHDSKETRP